MSQNDTMVLQLLSELSCGALKDHISFKEEHIFEGVTTKDNQKPGWEDFSLESQKVSTCHTRRCANTSLDPAMKTSI